jgi:Uma2 family endonuclease
MNMLTRAAEGLSRRAFTIADVERMVKARVISPDERLELIGGEIVPMSAKGSRHESLKVAIAIRWGDNRPPGFAFAPETGLRLDDYNYLEPDFIVFSRSGRLANVKGADVLLAVEVADSSLVYDLRRKPLVYASFGVRELWVVDAVRRQIHVHRDVTPERYAAVTLAQAGDEVVPRFAPAAFALRLDDLEEI